jgi:hypothetical protein
VAWHLAYYDMTCFAEWRDTILYMYVMYEAFIEVSLYLCCTATNCFLVGAVAGNTRIHESYFDRGTWTDICIMF